MISLIIPFYNCEKIAADTLSRVIKFNNQYPDTLEIIAVSDGSTDSTADVLHMFEKDGVRVVSYENNLGKGGAIKTGVEAACGDVVMFTDGDLAYGLEPIYNFAEAIKNCDIAVGSRRNDTELDANYGFLRSVLSRMFSCVVKMLLRLDVDDTQCGFKAYRADVAKKLFASLETTGFGFDIEILSAASKLDMKIVQVPVKLLTNEKNTSVNFIKDGLKMLTEIIKIRKRG